MDRALRRVEEVVDVLIVLSIENAREKQVRHKASLTIHVKGKDLRVEAASADMYTSIDQLNDKPEQPLSKLKDAKTEFLRTAIRSGIDKA